MNLEEFNLPIYYQKKKKTLNKNVIDDLELKESENNKSIYNSVFEPSNIFSELTLNKWISEYSCDKKFIKDSQTLISKCSQYDIPEDISFNEIDKIFNTINDDKDFNKRYSYITFDFLKNLNNNENILLAFSLYNISSPIISLLTPIILLIFPFIIIKLQGIEITFEKYFVFLKKVFEQHALGNLFVDLNTVSMEKKIYVIFSIAFYIYQIYQNIISCIEYFENLSNIHNYLFKLRSYLDFSIIKMNNFLEISKDLKTYKKFNNNLINNINFLDSFNNILNKITPYTFSFNKIKEIGNILKIFYNIKNDNNYLKAIKYSFYFNGYLENISQIKTNINNNMMNYSSITNKCEFKDAYYPPLKNNNPIKNSYKLDKHIIITGPNASGKTTILKTTAINIILNQQIGCGFFKNAKIKIYDYIHSYINIPDTSGRDSLFQAEARRCKDIIDIIDNNSKNKPFLYI